MVIDIISLSCVVVGIIILALVVLGRGKESDINKILYYWLIPLGLRILVVVGLVISFITDKSNYIICGIASIIPLWMFVILIAIEVIICFSLSRKISEVSSRYLLDALPRGQMQIDSELNLGLISELEAREKRNILVSGSLLHVALEQMLKYEKIECTLWLFANVVIGFISLLWQGSDFRVYLKTGNAVLSVSMLLNMVVVVILLKRLGDKTQVIQKAQ